MHGVHRLRVRWMLKSFFDSLARTPKSPADLVLDVAKLPDGRRSVSVALAYLVDETGAIQRCSVLQSSGLPAFDTGACSVMRKQYRHAPAKDKADKAWPVVRTQQIEFISDRTPLPDAVVAPGGSRSGGGLEGAMRGE